MAEDIGIHYTIPDTVNVWLHNLKAWVVNYDESTTSTLQSSQWSIEQIVNSKNHSGMPG